MRAIPVLTLVAAIGVLVPGSSSAGDTGVDPEKLEAIERLLEVSGEADLMKQGMLAMIDQMRPALAELPQEFFDEFKKAVLGDDLVTMVIPVYDRHFTLEEIEELTYFYESPIGVKLVKKQPLIQQDGMGVGQRWGEQKAAEIMETLRQRGVIPDEGAGE
jgi:hypothetical protein